MTQCLVMTINYSKQYLNSTINNKVIASSSPCDLDFEGSNQSIEHDKSSCYDNILINIYGPEMNAGQTDV